MIRGSANLVNGKLVLEDLDLTAREDDALKEWAERIAQTAYPNPEDTESRRDFVVRFTLLPDTVMDFLAETATEIRARIALNPETGTVRKQALWYEENLPAESLLWGIFAMSRSNYREDPCSAMVLLKSIPRPDMLFQLGGKAGVGRGLVPLYRRGRKMIPIRTHAVASAAYDRVDARHNCQNKKEYGALAHKLPGMILQNGLAQATGFLLAKDKHEHRYLLEDLNAVLIKSGVVSTTDSSVLHELVVQSDLAGTMNLTRRSLEASGWIKCYVQGVLKLDATGNCVGEDGAAQLREVR